MKGLREIILAGNPNVGKSTIFNAMTGLRQHTGNWCGKTVELTHGRIRFRGESFTVTDLPGTYSLISRSEEERLAADYIRQARDACTVIVCDATALARSLTLALQILPLAQHAVLCVSMMDEAEKAGLRLEVPTLQRLLGVPVVLTTRGDEASLERLMEAVRETMDGFLPSRPLCVCETLTGETPDETDAIAERFVREAERIANAAVHQPETPETARKERLDRIFLSRVSGGVCMLLLLVLVFWLTIVGANYPSGLLQALLDWVGARLKRGFVAAGVPTALRGALLDGMYATTARVVAVMLPPMAIFFPLFTLLEDFGYLPRVAFLLDERFRRCGACGKQALTLCMGFGCNAVGVTGCRIIDSKRERLLAILTNSLVPCNGRFPALIFLLTAFFAVRGFYAALALAGAVLLAVYVTLLASGLLSKTLLRGEPSSFLMELPPYRSPRVGSVLVRSLLDRTLFVLGRAVAVAAPAGLLIWLLANWSVGGAPILSLCARLLAPCGRWMGLSGTILLAFLLSFPANELLFPILVMLMQSGSQIGAAYGTQALAQLLKSSGWTWKTAVCCLILVLFHAPCSTTLLTIRKETGSVKWTLCALLLPVGIGFVCCVIATQVFRLLGL